MKKNIIFINVILILLTLTLLLVTNDNKTKYKATITNKIKKINTSVFTLNMENEETTKNKEDEDLEPLDKKVEDSTTKETTKEEIISNEKNKTIQNESVVENVPKQEPSKETSDNTIYVGKKIVASMVAYGADCCSSDENLQGRTASGYNLKKSGIYYNDKTYGQVRILASDKNFKLYSIIKVIDSKEAPYYAIVLDRADSNIGLNKKYLFDLAVESNQKAQKEYGVHSNVTFEVMRIGK